MGCASSSSFKQARCEHCQNVYSPLNHSSSMPVHYPAAHKGDSYHVVALTSTTLGSLKLDARNWSRRINDACVNHSCELSPVSVNGENEFSEDRRHKEFEFSVEVSKAKDWSDMIDERIRRSIPVTPSITPPGEPEMINAWELMEGLDDCSPLRPPQMIDRSFSFHAVSNYAPLDQLKPNVQERDIESTMELLVQANSVDLDTKLSPIISCAPSIDQIKSKHQEIEVETPKLFVQTKDIDLNMNLNEVISGSVAIDDMEHTLRETEVESPKKMWVAKDSDFNKDFIPIISSFDSDIISSFRKALEELSSLDNKNIDNVVTAPTKCPPRGEDKVVIYFTSLRGVRKTYEDCCHVRVILKSLGVRIDERDVSMHYGFREELKDLLGDRFSGGGLPKVFVSGKYIGGAEEIRELNEEGELEKVLRDYVLVEENGNGGGVCETCGDVRFVPCDRCSGSCKIFYEESDDDWEGEEGGGEFQRCPDCNENGIVLCQVCCY